MIIKNFLNLIKASIFQFVGIWILISFLLFFLNILVATSYSINNFSNDIKWRLWVYFYMLDPANSIDWDLVYSDIINLRSNLEAWWLVVEYYSKDDALRLLETRMPEIIQNFDKYWIENPLPPTMYVLFTDRSEYEYMLSVIEDYKSIIVNIEDVIQWQSFEDQNNRIANIINLTNFTILFSYFLVSVIIVIIITFLMFIIKSSFYSFYNQIQVEKLLWAQYWQIKSPFFIKMFSILLFWFVFMILYFSVLIWYLDNYLYNLFEVSLSEYIKSYNNKLLNLMIIEFWFIFMLSILISNFFLNRLIRKI